MPENAQEELLTACIVLISEKGPDGFSVREVAKAAGVNHGLVHRHFGSKSNLVAASYERVITDFSKLTAGIAPKKVSDAKDSGSPCISSHIFNTMSNLTHHLNCLIWIVKSNYKPESLSTIFPSLTVRDSTETPSSLEQKNLIAVLTSAALGWHLFKPLISAALNSDTDDIEVHFGEMLNELEIKLNK